MAFIAEQKKEGEQGGSTGLGGQSAFVGSGSGTPASKPTTPGTGYTNLGKYLEVNDGAGIGQAVNSKIAADTESFKSGAGKTFETNIANDISKGTKVDTKNIAGQLGSDPTKVNKQDYTNLAAGYTGPQSMDKVTGASNFNTGYQQIFDTISGLKNQDKQSNIVADSAKKDLQNGLSYSQGMKNLDGLFLQNQQPGIQKSIADAQTGLGSYKTGLETSFNTSRDAAAQTSKSTADAVTGARASARDALLGRNNQEMSSRNADLSNGVGSVQVGASSASLGDVLDSQELVNLEALSNLGGEQYDTNWYKRTYNPGQTAVAPLIGDMLGHMNAQAEPPPTRSGRNGAKKLDDEVIEEHRR